MKRDLLVGLSAVILAFAVFLPMYYVLSYGKSDGLESTLQQGSNSGTDGTYNAPLSYGENLVESLVYGIIGIVVVFAVFYALLLAVRRKKGNA